MELIFTVLQEIEAIDEDPSPTSVSHIAEHQHSAVSCSGDLRARPCLKEKIAAIKDSIDNMKSVNAFMLMSINR